MPKDVPPRLTLCLAMDLMGSTTVGLKLSTKRLDRFNLALVDQLGPYLRLLQLEHALVKFTGDGWLVMSDEQEDAAKLCCLAVIMANRFQWDIMAATGFSRATIPALRLAICWGRDLAVTLPNGHRDFVGNSVRHAVRACQLCEDNEILIDETVRAWVSHDFHILHIDFAARLQAHPAAKMEEPIVLHALEELKLESVEDAEAPVYFVNTLAVIGRPKEADQLANRISDHLLSESKSPHPKAEDLRARWNELLNSNLDHETARQIVLDLKKSGLRPDVFTYNALLEKSDSFRSENGWLEAMDEDGIPPNVDTLNICLAKARSPEEVLAVLQRIPLRDIKPNSQTLKVLVSKAPNYASALNVMQELVRAGVEVNAETQEKLIQKAEDFETARSILNEMIEAGHEPSENAFIETFSKGVLGLSADALLDWYLGLKFHPAHPVKRAMAQYRKAGRVEDALRLALDYPHTDTALKTIKQFPDRALEYFQNVVQSQPDHANGAYALGMALVGLKRTTEAVPWLRKAYQLAGPGHRKDELARFLAMYDGESSQP